MCMAEGLSVPPGPSQGWGLTVGLSRVLALCPRGLTEKQLFQPLMDWEGGSEDEVPWPRLCLEVSGRCLSPRGPPTCRGEAEAALRSPRPAPPVCADFPGAVFLTRAGRVSRS